MRALALIDGEEGLCRDGGVMAEAIAPEVAARGTLDPSARRRLGEDGLVVIARTNARAPLELRKTGFRLSIHPLPALAATVDLAVATLARSGLRPADVPHPGELFTIVDPDGGPGWSQKFTRSTAPQSATD